MSDDLSPVEQARAARWAADWLGDEGWLSKFAAASGAVLALRQHADEMDPPETVGSLLVRLAAQEREARWCRAERDKARDELARFQAWHAETERQREHWLGGDHSNQTPYPVVRE